MALWFALAGLAGAAEFSVATYNLHNYLLHPAAGRKAKTEASQAKAAELLAALHADVIALQEVGGPDALEDLRQRLGRNGRSYPHAELLTARDPAIRLAVLSRFPITSVQAHTNDQFLVEGTRQWVRRGLLETEIAVDAGYRFTLLIAHLKSKRAVPFAREAELRKQEASVLRTRVETILRQNPTAKLVVAGDLNDLPDSTAIRLLQGRGSWALADPAPAVRSWNPKPTGPPGNWTHHYRRADEHSRLDYLFLSPGMLPEHRPEQSFTADFPGWFEASDHRPVVVAFTTTVR